MLAPPDNPGRSALTRLLGTQPAALEPLPVARYSIASIALRLNSERWIATDLAGLPPRRRAAIAQLGIALASALPAGGPARIPWMTLAAPELRRSAATPLAHLEALGIEPAPLRTLLHRGIGSDVALHLCDAAPLFDVSVPALAVDLFDAVRRKGLDGPGFVYALGFVAGTLSSPAYVAIPVKDAPVVDTFLGQLDQSLARAVPTWRGERFGTHLQGEFYHLATKSGPPLRALGVRAGPVRYRVFWARIGDGLYIANQPGIFDELRRRARAVAVGRLRPRAGCPRHAQAAAGPGVARPAGDAAGLGRSEPRRVPAQPRDAVGRRPRVQLHAARHPHRA